MTIESRVWVVVLAAAADAAALVAFWPRDEVIEAMLIVDIDDNEREYVDGSCMDMDVVTRDGPARLEFVVVSRLSLVSSSLSYSSTIVTE